MNKAAKSINASMHHHWKYLPIKFIIIHPKSPSIFKAHVHWLPLTWNWKNVSFNRNARMSNFLVRTSLYGRQNLPLNWLKIEPTNLPPAHLDHKQCILWFEMKLTHKGQLYDHFWSFSCYLYVHLSQNWDSDGHFEVLNGSKSWLVQKLWPQM
jgi:hypothetical protein